MIKSTLILIPATLLFFAGTSFISDNKISVNQEIPVVAIAGDEFIVNVTIHKGDAEGAARLQYELPEGLTAEEMNSAGGDFTYEENQAKFIWTKLTDEKDLVVSYRIKTDKNATGAKKITGAFVCIVDGKTERYTLSPSVVNIQQKEVVETKTEFVETPEVENPIITRKLETIAEETGEYKMEITIHPNYVTQAATFKDQMPANFQAEAIEAHNAFVTIEDNTISFHWEKLPAEKEFKISYYARSGEPGPAPVINGYFTFDNDNDGKSQPKQIIANEVSPEIMKQNNSRAESESETVAIAKDNVDAKISKETVAVKTSKPVSKISNPIHSGISYRVQVSATQKSTPKKSEWFHSKYQIDSDVDMTYHEGWKKYLTGNFASLEEASSFKNKTSQKIPDAFIVAYENGVRISLEEAKRNKSINQ